MRLYQIVAFIVLFICFQAGATPEKVNAKSFEKDVEAPSWGDTQWINLPKGKKSLDVEDYRGKIVYLYFFQKW